MPLLHALILILATVCSTQVNAASVYVRAPSGISLSAVQNVNFAIFQASSQAAPAITYDITTYTACNGTGNDEAGFATWLSDVLTWQATHTGLVQLTVPTGHTCMFSGSGSAPSIYQGIKKLRVVGYGATFSDNSGAGHGFFDGGGVFAGISQVHPNRYGLVNTVSAGSSSITLKTPADATKWNPGDFAIITGGDLQGGGFPTIPYVWEYVQIVSANSSTGVVVFTAPLAFSYKSTWPQYSQQDPPFQGGPATLYAFDDQNWDTEQEYQGLTIARDGNLTFGAARSKIYRDVVITNLPAIPSQTKIWRFIGGSVPNQTEIDKLNETVSYEGTTASGLDFQSMSVVNFNLVNSTVGNLNGTGRNNTISGSTITNFPVGAHSYGASGPVSVSNTSMSNITLGGASMNHINLRGTWSGGMFTIPNNVGVTAAASGTGGVIRLTVTSSAGYLTGQVTNVNASPCTAGPQEFLIDVIDGTHVELRNTTFSVTCSGSMGVMPLNWAVPGGNIYFSGIYTAQGPAMKITDMTQDATNTYLTLSCPACSGGTVSAFPTMALDPNGTFGPDASVKVFPTSSFSCVSCVGSDNAKDLSNPGAQGVPLFQYSKRTYIGASATPIIPIWGTFVSSDVTVTSAYTGSSSIDFDINAFNSGNPFITILNNSTTTTRWGFTVNPKIASGTPREMLPTTTSGAQSGDSLAAPGAGSWLINNQIAPQFSSVPGDIGTTSVTIEIIANQGYQNFLLKRDLDPAANDNSPLWLNQVG